MHGVCVVICTCSVHSSTASSTVLLIAFHQSSIWKPDIGQESYFVPSLPAFDAPVTGLYIAITFGVKTRMVWLHDGEKFWRCFLYSFWWNTHTWQTDTTGRHSPCLCIESRGIINEWDYRNAHYSSAPGTHPICVKYLIIQQFARCRNMVRVTTRAPYNVCYSYCVKQLCKFDMTIQTNMYWIGLL